LIQYSATKKAHQSKWAFTFNGSRYLRVGGCGQCLGAGRTRSQKNAPKSRWLPHVRCTLCWAFYGAQYSLPENI